MPIVTPPVYAFGTITASGVAVDTQTITIGSKVYTTQAALTNVDGNVLMGANAAATLANLKAAINLEAGAGTTYATAMTIHPTVKATTLATTTLKVVAREAGVVGNHIPTTETQTNWAWGGAVLASGVGSLSAAIAEILATDQLNSSIAQALLNIDATSDSN